MGIGLIYSVLYILCCISMWCRTLKNSFFQGKVLSKTLCYSSVPLNKAVDVTRITTGYAHSHIRSYEFGLATRITTVDNGLRVASQESFGQYCTIGVFVDAGSRHESEYPSGLTHLLSKISFMGSSNFSTFENINAELENIGGVSEVKAYRDLMYFAISCYSFAFPQAMSLLSDVFWRPNHTQEVFKAGKVSAVAEYDELSNYPVPEHILMDLAHQASYRNNTLGLPGLCTPGNIHKITLSDIKKFISTYFIPSRLVIVGVNVNHDELLRLTMKHFIGQDTSWSDISPSKIDSTPAMYTGGMTKVSRLTSPVIGPNRLPDLTHIAVSLESSSYQHKDFYSFAILNSLMGGGGSFSAGGPGKGMYTQLYLKVLNKYHWIYHAQALNHAYNDSGIFCMFGSTHPQESGQLIDVLCNEFYSIASGFDEESVFRAKKMLQSVLLMNLESRSISFEDIGRQVLGHSKRYSAEYLCTQIDAVSVNDINRLGEKLLLENPVSVATLGDLSNIPEIEEIQFAFKSRQSIFQNCNKFLFH